MDQVALVLGGLSLLLEPTTCRQLTVICQSMLCMTGRVSMLGISRWAGKGGSYRTVQRFFKKRIPWDVLNWNIVKHQISRNSVILIAGDATTVTKSGKHTFGIGKFFSSIYSRAIPGISFQCLSLIDVESRKSWPILTQQILPVVKELKVSEKKTSPKRGRGRPKGSKNKNKADVTLNAEMMQLQSMLKGVSTLIGKTLKPTYFVYDGALGNNNGAQMTMQVGLHLISKLRYDSALYLPWEGVYSGKGRPPIYGAKIDYKNIPDRYLKSYVTDDNVDTRTYQIQVRHKNFANALNVVIICKNNMATGKKAHVVLFSTDMNLEYSRIQEYYSLRFQIEFNFRDAKQFWGLEDFYVTEKQAVLNSANISLFMVNVSHAALPTSNAESILDLRSHYHGLRYAKEVFKLLPKNVELIKNDIILAKVSAIGRIHDVKLAA